MAAAVLDTHRIVKRLQDAGASEPLAETWTDILREARELDQSQLATKADLDALRTATKTDIDALRAETKADIALVRADINALRAETKADIGALRLATRNDVAEVRAELIKWMFGIAAGQLGLLFAFLKLFPGGTP